LDPKNKLLLVDSNTEEVFLSGDQHNPFPAAPAADPEQPGAATLTPFVRWVAFAVIWGGKGHVQWCVGVADVDIWDIPKHV
jgi:hypothetical protein